MTDPTTTTAAPLFTVERRPNYVASWYVIHTPSGLPAGAFYYKRHAQAAAKAMQAVGAEHDLTVATPSTEALAALLRARKPHDEADSAQAKADEEAR